mgnify:CR=1 FL=1
MATQTATATKDQITIPVTMLDNLTWEFEKIKNMYEELDHYIAMQDVKNWNVSKYSNADDFLSSLDN